MWVTKSAIRPVASYARVHEGPLIFAGDLNTWNKRRARTVDRLLRGPGPESGECGDRARENGGAPGLRSTHGCGS